MTAAEALDRGRESLGRRAWADAYAQLSAADRESPLEAEDLPTVRGFVIRPFTGDPPLGENGCPSERSDCAL